MRRIVVVGGGASGIIASLVAARNGAEVTLIEKQNRIGKKILVTGNGRCNITNVEIDKKYYHSHSNVDFSYPLMEIDYEKTMSFFEELGIIRLIEGTRVYPLSEQASSVLEVLRIELENLKVKVITDTKVTSIIRKEGRWLLNTEQGTTYKADKIIFATGGMAAPQLGCDGMGYTILKNLGHTLVPAYPTLVHILSPERYCKMMQGAKIKGEVSIYVEEKLIRKEQGEVLFTEDGLSGPPVFQISRVAAQSKKEKKKCYVTLDLFPNIEYDQIISLIYSRIARHPQKTIEEMFLGWIHKRMIVPIIKNADIGPLALPCENLEHEQIESLASTIKSFRFEVNGTRGFKYAQATAGGIHLKDINFQTMESKKVKGLYIIGEILDVDGDCGGYNLQWAWSTGYIAGLNAATSEE